MAVAERILRRVLIDMMPPAMDDRRSSRRAEWLRDLAAEKTDVGYGGAETI